MRQKQVTFLLGMLLLGCAEPPRPNVLLFLVDDLGWTDLGCYGSDLYETPHIDRLAAEGVRFTQAYSACTVCSPTRAALMTGKSPAQLHLTDWIAGHDRPDAPLAPPDWTQYLPLEETTLAELLQEAGYATASIGKWHLGDDSIYYPQHQGFDLNVAGYKRGQPPSYFAPYQNKRWPHIPYLAPGDSGEYLTDRLTDEAIRFIEGRGEKPFFLYLPHYAVHTPLQAPDSLVAYYEGKPRDSLRHQNATYAAMIHSTDQSMGRLLALLEERGELDHTLVIFASDNGGLELRDVTENAPLRAGKGSAYEGGTRTPFILRLPDGQRAGSETDLPAISMDVLPTVLDFLGLAERAEALSGLEGRSLLPGLASSPDRTLWERPLYWHYPHYHPGGATPYSAIRLGRWKLYEFFEDGHLELYDLEADLSETENLAGTESEQAAALHAELKAWRARVGAQLPVGNPRLEAD